MYEIKDVVQDLKAAMRRRRALLIITPCIFIIAAFAAIYLIKPKYESSTSIMVQKDETLNPLVLYEMAVTIASEDRLKSFNEIVYSRSTIEMLIDSLRLDREIKTKLEKQNLIERIKKNIKTSSNASDSFEISYMDADPVVARDGAELLASHFINTRLRMESRRNQETVTFFSNKLDELEAIVNRQRSEAVDVTSERVRVLPNTAEAMQERLKIISESIDTIEWEIFQEEENLNIVKAFQDESATNIESAIKQLYKLPLTEIQFGDELSGFLNEYDDLHQKFTGSYPKIQELSAQIQLVANRIPPTIDANIKRLETKKEGLTHQKEQVVSNLQQIFVSTQIENSDRSDLSIYEELYNEMKVKLEQAKMSRDIGDRSAEQFIVLDSAVIAEKPASPNKRLILAIGLVMGIIMGVAVSTIAEIMDTTIRSAEDLPFEKPIIAYLTNA